MGRDSLAGERLGCLPQLKHAWLPHTQTSLHSLLPCIYLLRHTIPKLLLMQGYFDITLSAAAGQLGVGVTTLKKVWCGWLASVSFGHGAGPTTPMASATTSSSINEGPMLKAVPPPFPAAVPREWSAALAVPCPLLAAPPAGQDEGEAARLCAPARSSPGRLLCCGFNRPPTPPLVPL